MNKYKNIELKPLNLVSLDRERKDDDDFTIDFVETANELRESLMVSSMLQPQININKLHLAVLMGLMVRLYKLYDTYVFLIVEKRQEMALILGRSACETIIDLSFLCSKLNEEEFDKFIKSSLATGRKIFDEVEEDKRKGYGDPNIQSRIQSSIENDFKEAGYAIEDVKSSDLKCFGDVYSRANDKDCNLGREYIFIFKNLSRVTHGNWSELIKYHLRKKDNLFYPNHVYDTVSPQSLDGISIMIARAAEKYVSTVASGYELSHRLKKIRDWFEEMAKRHEKFLIDLK